MNRSVFNSPQLTPPWRIGIDVGGTFTDLVLADANGRVAVHKVPSTPAEPSRGVIAAIAAAAEAAGLRARDILEGCSHLVHGSTVATNIVLEQKGARVGMLVTRGFRDSLAIRRGIRPNAWDHRSPFPPVLVPRYLRLPVRGRLDRRGKVVEPLSEEDVRKAAQCFRREGVQSVAVCLYNSFLEACHEEEAARILTEELPGIPASLSARIAPVMGEYERGSTAVLNAYVAPAVIAYVSELRERLEAEGLSGAFYLVRSNGGAASAEEIVRRPADLLLSGPAAATGGLSLFGSAFGAAGALSMEIGGTSCDVMLLHGGRVDTISQYEVGGYHAALPSVDIHTIGAGGGTIAGVDNGGLLFVGPQGAGADPGPASYGLGGGKPTVTDAQLLLGRLRPGPLAAGRSLSRELALEALAGFVAGPLALSPEKAASGVLQLVEQQIFHALQKISSERGHDPRRFVLVAAGGAGPLHACAVARLLGCTTVYVPRMAGVFCALGMLNLPITHEFGRALCRPLDAELHAALAPILAKDEETARLRLKLEGFGAETIGIFRSLELRHPGQIGALRVEIGPEGLDPAILRREFLKAYERRYGHRDEQAPVEVTGTHIVGRGVFPALHLRSERDIEAGEADCEQRTVYFPGHGGWQAARVVSPRSFGAAERIVGPALVEEDTTVLVIEPGFVASIDSHGNYVLRRETELGA